MDFHHYVDIFHVFGVQYPFLNLKKVLFILEEIKVWKMALKCTKGSQKCKYRPLPLLGWWWMLQNPNLFILKVFGAGCYWVFEEKMKLRMKGFELERERERVSERNGWSLLLKMWEMRFKKTEEGV